jgi:hypothetical protein
MNTIIKEFYHIFSDLSVNLFQGSIKLIQVSELRTCN